MMVNVRCPICKNRHSCMEIGIDPSEGCGMFALDDPPKRLQTNADRIRSMSDEELAEFAVSTGQGCAPGENLVECCFDHKDGLIEADCRKCWLDWLRQEVDDGNNS